MTDRCLLVTVMPLVSHANAIATHDLNPTVLSVLDGKFGHRDLEFPGRSGGGVSTPQSAAHELNGKEYAGVKQFNETGAGACMLHTNGDIVLK